LKLFRGFVMLGLVLPASAQYAGPAILSRGQAPAAMEAPTVDFNFSVGLNAGYTTGLSGVGQPNAQGQLATASSVGAGVNVGLSGAHSWKHTHLGLNYTGTYTYYPDAGSYNSIGQGLSIGLNHQFSKHISFTLRENAGMFTQFSPSTTSLNYSVPFDPSQSFIPSTDFYNNRTIYSTTQALLTIQKSTRLSFSLGGGYFANLRSNAALFGATGEMATGDAQYRISKSTTIGGTYSFDHFGFTHSFGGTYIHTAGLSLSTRIDRWTELSLSGGASRVESSFEQTVPIDPSILAILCPANEPVACPLAAGTVISHSVFWGPNFSVRLSRSFHRGVAYISAGESITPGNGLFLTSKSTSAAAGYGYSGLKKWNMNVSVTYGRSLSLANVTGSYSQVAGFFGMSRQIVSKLSFYTSLSATQYQSGSFSLYNRFIYTASAGVGWSSRSIPLRFF
jgi:hypothetical protein